MEEYATSLSPIRPLVAYSPLTLWHRSAYALANPPKGIAKADSLGGFWDLQRPRARHGAPDRPTTRSCLQGVQITFSSLAGAHNQP